MQEQISKYHPGDKVDVTVIRNKSEKVFTAVLLSKDGSNEISSEINRDEKKVLGAEIENTSREERLSLKIKHGVKIVKLGNGVFKQKGVPLGFVITQIDKTPMYTTKDVETLLKGKSGAVLIEGVTSKGDKEAFAIRLD